MNLAEYVYEAVKSDLLSGKLNSNGLIIEQAIAEQYRVSKTPAREALNRLALEGYLTKYPRKGYLLRKLSDDSIHQLLELRYHLLASYVDEILDRNSDQELADFANLITKCEDPQIKIIGLNTFFYLEFAKLSRNPWVYRMVEQILMFSHVCSDEIYSRYLTSLSMAKEHQQNIINSLLKRDSLAVKQYLREDILHDSH